MNKIVNNLAQIADAAEYFDRKTGAAWKIRSALTNMIVWACNSYLYACRTDNQETIALSMIEVATLRTWVRDSNDSAFVLDLTPAAVTKTLGLKRVVDIHEEAVRSARQKCIQTRSALSFKKYYDAAIASYENQQAQRRANVEAIANLVSDNQFLMTHELADHFEYRGLGHYVPESFVNDDDLYDDDAVQRQSDQIAETLGNALEAMYDVCDAELAGAITADKVNRLTGYHRAITNMMSITGVDMKKLGMRRAKLEQLIESQIKLMDQSVAEIDKQIAEQLAPKPVEPEAKKPARMHRVKKEDLAKELAK